MALGAGFFGCLARWSKGLGRDPAAFEEAAPYLASSVSDVWAETGLWAGKKWNIGGVWYGGKKKKRCFALQPARRVVPRQVRGCQRSHCFRGSGVGFGSRNECCALFTNQDVAFSWQGRSRVENVGILVSASHGLAAFVCHRE